jgi:hypothetical protein
LHFVKRQAEAAVEVEAKPVVVAASQDVTVAVIG